LPETPRILITNDDGHRARGILALAEALEAVGEVVVVAPHRQRSAVSHSITLHKPLRIWEERPNRFVCTGSPVDCVYVAVHEVCKARRPDIVVSGINRGANLGNDVFYSGTVAGAMEGLLMGIHSIAMSQLASRAVEGHEIDYGPAAELACDLARRLLADPPEAPVLLNVNVPWRYERARGVRVATLGRRVYGQGVVAGTDPRGAPYYWIGGSEASHDAIPGSDCVLVEEGYATVTPVRSNLTNEALLGRVETLIPR
jgi:5'-nucleotidase